MAETPPELQVEIEKLERKHGENPEGRYFVPLANAYRKLGQLQRAESLLREGLRRHPDYLSAHIVLGRCLADRGATDEATEEFRYVLSLDPQNLIALRSLGDLSLGSGRVDDAGRWYNELLRADPMNEEARRALESLQPPAWSEPVPAAATAEPAPEPEPVGFEPSIAEPRYDDLVLSDSRNWVAGSGEIAPAVPDRPDEDAFFDGYVDLEDGADDLPVLEESPELVTETIAELYARQGLYERAADVYRELIRRRGDDAGLQRRLREVERLAAGETLVPGEPARQEEASAVPLSVPEVTVPETSFEDELPDGSWLADFPDADPIPEAAAAGAVDSEGAKPESLELRDEPTPPTIAQFLAELASWHPRATPGAGAEWVQAPHLPFQEPQTTASTGAADEGLLLDGTGTAGEDPFLWGDPQPEAREPFQGQVDVAPLPVPDEAGADQHAGVAGVEDPQEQHPEPVAAQEHELPVAEEPRSASVEDDDDLESFQAWLRSLKR